MHSGWRATCEGLMRPGYLFKALANASAIV
jgi:hypothetical protein